MWRISALCPECSEEVEFEQFTVDTLRCWHCGVWLQADHECGWSEDEGSYCYDYLSIDDP